MGVAVIPPLYLPTELIVNGKPVSKNLKELHLAMEWLTNELAKLGVDSVEEVFYAELQSDGTVHINKGHHSV